MGNSVTAMDIMAYRVSIIERDTQAVKLVAAASTCTGIVAACVIGHSFWSVVATYLIWSILSGIALALVVGIVLALVDNHNINKLSQ